jgi:DNA (cytosine-5)-methyltransferase 1
MIRAKISAIDLFCGAGGLTQGLRNAGINVIRGVDNDEDCRYPYTRNNPASKFELLDIAGLKAQTVATWFGRADYTLLAGCAPCQPFSSYSRGARKDGSRRLDSRWSLLRSFGKLVRQVRPHLVTMENVPQLVDDPVFIKFLADLDGYSWTWSIVDCASLGIPQTRRRFVLLASRLGTPRLETAGLVRKTVRDAIGRLPRLTAGEEDPTDRLHKASGLSPLNRKRIRASVAGGTWRDWPKSILAECHKRESGVTFPSVYGRMKWDEPSPTITTQCFGFGNGRFGHPEQDRAISLREAALLQTFPSEYQFVPDHVGVRFKTVGKLIGNAVPVRLGEKIGTSLVSHIRAVESRSSS